MHRFVFLGILLFSVSLSAQEKIQFEGPTLTSPNGPIALPCSPTTHTVESGWLLATCPTGLLVVELGDTPKPVALLKGVKFLKVGDGTWIETADGSVPFADSGIVKTPDDPPIVEKPETPETPELPETPIPEENEPIEEPPAPKQTWMEGAVILVEPAFATIDLGTKNGLKEDDHIEFFRRVNVDLGGNERVDKVQRISVGRVETVSESRARIQLGLNEIVPPDALARTTDLPLTRRPVVPRRVGNVWDAQFLVRPLLALNTLGGGAIIDGEVTYHFRSPFALSLKLLPFGFGIAREGNVLTFAGNIFGSYDTTAFEVGLGIGASKVNTLSGRTDFFVDKPSLRAGFSTAQFVRLEFRGRFTSHRHQQLCSV